MARPRGNRKEARLSVSFDASDYAQLSALAVRQNVSVAWLIRKAVLELIGREREAADNPQLPFVRRAAPQRGAAP